MSKEFKRRLQEEAKKEHRSVTNYLEFALTGLWERRGSTAEDAELLEEENSVLSSRVLGCLLVYARFAGTGEQRGVSNRAAPEEVSYCHPAHSDLGAAKESGSVAQICEAFLEAGSVG